jgi:hypothetical protein
MERSSRVRGLRVVGIRRRGGTGARVGRPGVVSTRGRRLVSALPAQGELWWCEVAEIGQRPVVVLSRDAAIPWLRRALVAPCTTTIRALASEVVLEPGNDPISGARRSIWTRSRASRSPCSSAGSAGCPMLACVRSARRSKSRSTAEADAALPLSTERHPGPAYERRYTGRGRSRAPRWWPGRRRRRRWRPAVRALAADARKGFHADPHRSAP